MEAEGGGEEEEKSDMYVVGKRYPEKKKEKRVKDTMVKVGYVSQAMMNSIQSIP